MPTDWNPTSVEDAIRKTSNEISRSVDACDIAYRAFLAADHEYDIQVAKAFAQAEGSVDARKHQVTLATVGARQVRDDTDATYRYADRRAKALTDKLRAMQSIGASIRQQYQTAGVGER